jgi:hypothetical protein
MLLLVSCRSNGTSQREEVAKQQFKEELETLQRLAKGNTNEVEVKEENVYLVKKSIVENLDTGKKYVERVEKYDAKDNLLSLVSNRKNGELFYYEKYQYNDEGEVMKSTILREPFGAITRTYSYDKQGKKIGYLETNEKGEKCGEGLYKYYEGGQLKYQYTNDQYTKAREEIYYNEEGEKERVIYKGLMFDTVSTFEREFNQQGVKVKEIEIKQITNTDETILCTTYFNDKGKKVKYIAKNGDTIKSWYEWEYDKEGNRTRFISKDENGNIESVDEYDFDENGNKIKHIDKELLENNTWWIIAWDEYEYDKNNRLIRILSKDSDGIVGLITNYEYEKVNKGGRVNVKKSTL